MTPICLINPPKIFSEETELGIFQPLGLAYIAAILEKEDFNVTIIDAFGESWEKTSQYDATRKIRGMSYDKLKNRIRHLSPDIVGITIQFSTMAQSAFQVASIVKSIDQNIIVIVGGPHPTVQPKECLKNNNIDIVVIGEGEYTFLDLVKNIRSSGIRSIKDVDGIAFKCLNEIIFTPKREYIYDLDLLPYPARHLLPMDKYLNARKKGFKRRGIGSIITSRGCPFDCCFCSIHLTMGKKWRFRSPKNVVAEIKHLVEDFGITTLDIEDDNFTFNKHRVEEICDLIIESGLKIKWRTPNGVRADTIIDENLLKKMKLSGCEELRFAPESGVQRVIDQVINKKLKLTDVEKAIDLCKNVGIRTRCFFIIGLIGETKDDMLKTIFYAQKLEREGTGYQLNIACPLYGTKFYNDAVKGGYLKNINDDNLSYENVFIETPEFNTNDVVKLYRVGKEKIWKTLPISELIKSASANPRITLKYIHDEIQRILLTKKSEI